MKEELLIIENETIKLLSQKDQIQKEIKSRNVARCIIGTDNLICTISIIKKPKNENQEIRLFEELDKLQGVMKK